jgi:hypothetical protein
VLGAAVEIFAITGSAAARSVCIRGHDNTFVTDAKLKNAITCA